MLFFSLALLTCGCIENFNPETDQDISGLYAIDGRITDKDPAKIRIQKALAFDYDINDDQFVSGATVILYDDQGIQERLDDLGDGDYEGITPGEFGRSYYIKVHLPDGMIVVSIPELLSPSASIGELSISGAERYRINSTGLNTPIYGLNLNLYIDHSDTISTYYKWIFTGTYMAKTPFDMDGPPCYVTEDYQYFFVLGESVTPEKDLLFKNLRFIEGNERYAFGYSLQVVQHALTEEAYNYWKKIDDQQKNVGSIFDSPPAQILGNLRFTGNENPVLGYFEVSSVRKKRIFIRPTDFLFKPEVIWVACFPPPVLIPHVVIPSWCEDCLNLPNSTKEVPPFWPPD